MIDVLVVDDDRDTRETVRDLLEDEGLRVAVAGDGADALAWLRAHDAPRLVLLDLSMPTMDGPEFRRLQRKDEILAKIPVVVVSAAGEMPDQLASMAAEGHLAKPVKLEDMLSVVRKFCPQV